MSRLEKFLECTTIDSIDQSSAIDAACETDDPDTLVKVLEKFPKTTKYFCHIRKSYEAQTRLNAWDAIGRGTCDVTKPVHSAKMAAVIISHPFFVGDCELVSHSPDAWQSMIGLFRAAYGSDPLIWNAVKNNANLPEACVSSCPL